MNLYTLTQQYQNVMELLYSDMDEETVLDTLEGLEGEIEDKADGYVRVIKNIEGDIAALDAEEKRIKERKQALKHKTERMKKSLEEAMRAIGTTKIKTPLFGVSIQKNPPSVEVLDEEKAIACGYATTVTQLDKAALKEALKEGKQFSFARLVQGESLRIR